MDFDPTQLSSLSATYVGSGLAVTGASKYPLAEPEALRLPAPQRGLIATGKSNRNRSRVAQQPASTKRKQQREVYSRNSQSSTATPAEPGSPFWMRPLVPLASAKPAALVPYVTGLRMAATPATAYRAYRSKVVADPEVATWLQVDLGKSSPIGLLAQSDCFLSRNACIRCRI